MSESIITSLIGGGFAVIVAMIGYLAHANKRDHQMNTGKLDRVLEATDALKTGHQRIESKIDSHIDNHAKGLYE